MKNHILGALTVAALLGTTNIVLAQNAKAEGAKPESEVTRVVIAPPKNALASTIKTGLSDAYYAARPESRAYKEAQKLYFFYGARHFEPLWLSEDSAGKVTFSPNAQKIIDTFKSAALSGLNPADYLSDDIDIDLVGSDPADMAALETAFSGAALRYAKHIQTGRINPRSIASDMSRRKTKFTDAEMLMRLAAASDPAAMLASLEPKHREYKALKAALAEMDDGQVEEQITVPSGPLLRPGRSDKRVPIIRERLGVAAPVNAEGVADPTNTKYDKVLVAAVKDFQREIGIIVDGVAGPATIAAMNGGGATTREDIIANMEAWRWLPEDLGEFRVFVNIPEFRVAVMRDEEVEYSTRVVVGKPKHRTPVFSDEIEHVVVNPYWNVPASIARNEIAPILARNPGYIARNNMELLHGGKVIDASSVDWSTTSVRNFRIRQRPGRGNALGSVKFLFPNRHNVYLHDTPSKSLFSRSYRAYSHGCVRVHNPWDFAQALLKREKKVTVASLESQRGRRERWNNLETHIPVHIAYLTLRVNNEGEIRSFGDVYGHIKKLKKAMAQ